MGFRNTTLLSALLLPLLCSRNSLLKHLLPLSRIEKSTLPGPTGLPRGSQSSYSSAILDWASHSAPARDVTGMEVVDVGCFSLFAYIDPGSGTLVLQVILASVLGGLFSLGAVLRKCWPRAARRGASDRPGVRDEVASS